METATIEDFESQMDEISEETEIVYNCSLENPEYCESCQ